MESAKEVITLTFGDCAENHKGMEMIGKIVNKGEGFSLEDLHAIQTKFESIECKTELHILNNIDQPEAAVLIIRDGVNCILRDQSTKESLAVEQKDLIWDKKAFMYGRVVNKHARWNICYSDEGHPPHYEEGKGRVISYKDVPILSLLRNELLPKFFGMKATGLKCEGNYYYDIAKCGIGFHGDSERRKVIAIRLGAELPIHYQWFHEGKPVGDRIILNLKGGDIYVMSEKAVGTDWKSRKIYTLRHATGCEKFTSIVE